MARLHQILKRLKQSGSASLADIKFYEENIDSLDKELQAHKQQLRLFTKKLFQQGDSDAY